MLKRFDLDHSTPHLEYVTSHFATMLGFAANCQIMGHQLISRHAFLRAQAAGRLTELALTGINQVQDVGSSSG